MSRLLDNPNFRRIIFFFPFQLVFLHVKKNLLLLSIWGLLFGFVTQSLAARYGVPYLFLNPEYLDAVNPLSYFIIGFACGGFVMAFNIASYILNSYRFPFLATLSNPFTKYCINNFIIPCSFVLVYVINIISFLSSEQIYSSSEIFSMVLGFLLGFVVFVFLGLFYFFQTNKDIHRMFGVKPPSEEKTMRLLQQQQRKGDSWKNIYLIKESRDWYVETYLAHPFKIRLVRAVRHYKREMLRNVFSQNHRNAAIFSFVTILSLFVLGFFREVHALMIPAGASIFLLLTMFIMLPVPLYSVFKGWAPVVLLVSIVALNFLYRMDFFNNINKVYGMNYGVKPSSYDNKTLNDFASEKDTADADFKAMLEILNKWRLKNLKTTLEKNEKPKFVIVCTSGGGLRSSLWTFQALQYADSLLKGELLKHTALITGSSGGMIGAAYLRELYWQNQAGKVKDLYRPSYRTNISKDILNAVAFSIGTSDWFVSMQSVKYGKNKYNKDRGYIFERRLDENLGNVFSNRRLNDYKPAEAEAKIPMMIFSPTMVNDGRKLVISSQPVSFLIQTSKSDKLNHVPLNDAIEFSRFFRKQNSDSILFTSVLRMSSTFPYITPIVSLPSKPAIEIMDSGMRDNYGIEVALKFLYVFRNWIATNTSGVVIIQIRDRHKEFQIEENPPPTMLTALTRPLGSFYGNLFTMQDLSQNQQVEFISSWFDGKTDVLDFQLQNEIPDKISLSWHLTNHEKNKVLNSINLPENRKSIERLRELFE
ncbi:MAG: patatin-like phospholipase family protein [Bacteroidetes bacterium]|nr:patatin-like phospholipase family protein [Bacteroidota bacterium]